MSEIPSISHSNQLSIKQGERHSDTRLIQDWQQGDEKAFDGLYHKYFPRLLQIAIKKTGHQQVAEELVQDTFLRVYRNRDTIVPSENFDNYLFIALRNNIFNYIRQLLSQQKKQAQWPAWLQQMPVTADPQQLLEHRETSSALQQVIEQQLPQQCQTVYRLSREEQLSHREIAERLQISTNTVEQHMRKALRILKAAVKTSYVWVILYWLFR